jgi:hypothetical protein
MVFLTKVVFAHQARHNIERMLLILRLPRNLGSPCISTVAAGLQIRILVMLIPKIGIQIRFYRSGCLIPAKYVKSSLIFERDQFGTVT